MAQSAKRFKRDNEQFPILFERGNLQIYKNPTDEIFIEDLQTGASIRLNVDPRGGLQFTTGAHELVEPERVSNMIGWRISKR